MTDEGIWTAEVRPPAARSASPARRGPVPALRDRLLGLTRARRLPPASWPLVDQGIVSLGTFLFNVVLARSIPLGDYGRYAMTLGILLLMQAVTNSLIFYPLCVRGVVLDEAGRRGLVMASLALTALLALPLALVLAILVWWLIDPALVLPAVAVLLAGLVQEAMRRGLLSGMRHRSAILGDAVSYAGQVVALAVLARATGAGLASALYAMAATSLAGAAVQFVQMEPRKGRPPAFPALVSDFWRLGKWSLMSNVLGLGRVQALLWLLSLLSGPAAAGALQIVLNIFNLTAPIVTAICNIVPQAAARALPGGYRAAWRAARPLILTGFPIVAGCALVMLVLPERLVALFYGTASSHGDIVDALRILAGGTLLAYASTVACAFLHGVDGGREGLVGDLVSAAAMLGLVVPLTAAYGLLGGCVALVGSLFARTVALVVAIRAKLSAADRPPVPHRRPADALAFPPPTANPGEPA